MCYLSAETSLSKPGFILYDTSPEEIAASKLLHKNSQVPKMPRTYSASKIGSFVLTEEGNNIEEKRKSKKEIK
jgi:hypothetical protein